MKHFNAKDFEAIQKIVGKQLVDIFKQLDFFVINFGEKETEYSLHTYAYPRISYKQKIILTGTDEYYDKEYHLLSSEEYEKDELHTNSLLFVTSQKAKDLLHDSKIVQVDVSPIADIKIFFENGAQIDIFPNCSEQDCEHYSFFKYRDYSFPHYVVRQKRDTIFLEKINVSPTEKSPSNAKS